MPATWKLNSVLLALCFASFALLNSEGAQSQSKPQQTSPSPKSAMPRSQASPAQQPKANEEEQQGEEDEEYDPDPAPAAVSLDVSNESPLIKELYQATRETKEKQILDSIDRAKHIAETADLKATDAQGRTALHWVVFGSSYTMSPKVQVEYEEIADQLIARGIDINKEDHYQDTALDYLLYSPNFEMQTLLIEHGANSGFLASFSNYVTDKDDDDSGADAPAGAKANAGASPAKNPWPGADLKPGQTLSVRLDTPVYSDKSRTGDPIRATVTYPLCKTGENIRCADGQLVIPPGTKVNGTVLFAQKAPNKYMRPRLVLDFSNVVHKNGEKTALYARVLDVDNARETVRNNEIIGIVQPHAGTKTQLVVAGLSAANPIAGYTIKGVQTVYGLSIRREVAYPAGTDIQIQIVRPAKLKQKEEWAGWPMIPVDGELQHIVSAAPLRTTSTGGTPSDPTNLIFIGSMQQIQAGFGEAGWIEADNTNVKSAIKVAQATVRQSGYNAGPMSTLLLDGKPPDMMFQKSLNTFAKRHHIRVWKLPKQYNGQDVWIGAATHDIATMNSRAKTKWTHRIDPHVDRERDWVETDLLFVGTATGYADVERPRAPHKISNATGDEIVTDGKITVVKMGPMRTPPQTAAAPATASPTR